LRWYGAQFSGQQHPTGSGARRPPFPFCRNSLPPGYWAGLEDAVQGAQRGPGGAHWHVLLAVWQEGYTNSVIGMQPGQQAIYRYDKHHLVPFGEFIPPLFKWFTEMMNIPLGDFNRGSVGQPSFEVAGQRLAPHVCYEDLFGEELGARFIDPAKAPTIFVNVSNIGWFGNTVAIDQHLQISAHARTRV
jgi:apolipoprotein N-acyltransferase